MENEMTDIQMTQKLNHDQTVDFIVANPHIRAYIVGEPGIGKSYLIKEIGRRTGLPTAYIDMPNLDLGDVAMPVIDHESRVTRYYPNARVSSYPQRVLMGATRCTTQSLSGNSLKR
jgi:ribosome biogenesis GTPase A